MHAHLCSVDLKSPFEKRGFFKSQTSVTVHPLIASGNIICSFVVFFLFSPRLLRPPRSMAYLNIPSFISILRDHCLIQASETPSHKDFKRAQLVTFTRPNLSR